MCVLSEEINDSKSKFFYNFFELGENEVAVKALKRFLVSVVTGKNSKSSPKLLATFKLFRLYIDVVDDVDI